MKRVPVGRAVPAMLEFRDETPRKAGERFSVQAVNRTFFRGEDGFLGVAEMTQVYLEQVFVGSGSPQLPGSGLRHPSIVPRPFSAMAKQVMGSGWRMDTCPPRLGMTLLLRTEVELPKGVRCWLLGNALPEYDYDPDEGVFDATWRSTPTPENAMADTLGSLIDKLATVNQKTFLKQELLYEIRRSTFAQFQEKYLATEAAQRQLYDTLHQLSDLNVQRQRLIQEVDQKAIEIAQAAARGDELDDGRFVQRQHKTYQAPGGED